MPDSRRNSRFALAAAFDARDWSGVAVLQRGAGADVSLPSYGTGEGIYLDGLHFLHGFAVSSSMSDDVTAYDLTITIDPDTDAITITNDSLVNVTLGAAADNAIWGLPTGATVIANGGGTLTGASDWRRGLVTNGLDAAPPRLSFVIPAVGVRTAPAEPAIIQDVRVALRTRGTPADVDDTGVTTLEALDNATNDNTDNGFRWAVDDDGHVVVSGTATSAQAGITWLSTSFRDRLGFTGDEELTTDDPAGAGSFTSGYMYVLRASRPFPGLIVPRRPLMTQTPIQTEIGAATRLVDARYSSSHVGSYRGYVIEWVMDGPDGAVDLHTHWLDMRRDYLRAGEPVTLYQNWGDSRRALAPNRVTVDQVAYDILTTSERAGYRGRLLCRLHPGSAEEEQIEWEGMLRLRARMTHRLDIREDDV